MSVGTDIGGGTSYSMLRTLGEAYKVQQLLGTSLSPAYALYLATLGGARALSLDDEDQQHHAGPFADFALLDPAATPLLASPHHAARRSARYLLCMMTLGDDRAIAATYASERCVHRRVDAVTMTRCAASA